MGPRRRATRGFTGRGTWPVTTTASKPAYFGSGGKGRRHWTCRCRRSERSRCQSIAGCSPAPGSPRTGRRQRSGHSPGPGHPLRAPSRKRIHWPIPRPPTRGPGSPPSTGSPPSGIRSTRGSVLPRVCRPCARPFARCAPKPRRSHPRLCHCEGPQPRSNLRLQEGIALLRPSQPGYRPPRNDKPKAQFSRDVLN